MDTRISGDMLESALVAGICSVGAHAMLAGVIPTPAVAYLVRKYRMDAGVMISASHNPVEYNGIKFFDNQGYKLSDELEDEIEEIIVSRPEILPTPTGMHLGTKSYAEDAVGRELDEDEVMAILDYAIGFISDSKYKDCAEQAAEFVGLIEFDDDYEEE
jgi:phosphomannomutase